MDSDIFSKISAMLDDPDTADKLKQVASSIGMSGGGSEGEGLGGLGALMQGGSNKNIALLNAITPYLRPSRASKVSSAIKAIQVISVISSLK